jgi:hypothetical protein
MCMDAKTDDNFSLICDLFLKQKEMVFTSKETIRKKGGLPRPLVTLSVLLLLLHPPPAVADQSDQTAPQQEHRGGLGDGCGSVLNYQ